MEVMLRDVRRALGWLDVIGDSFAFHVTLVSRISRERGGCLAEKVVLDKR